MISWNDFENAVCSQLRREITTSANPEQNQAIRSPSNESLFIVAGPGSGKTTVISLGVLKLILVDGVEPSAMKAGRQPVIGRRNTVLLL